MSLVDRFILRVKRRDGVVFGFLHVLAKSVFYFTPPRVPSLLKPFFRLLYELHYFVVVAVRWVFSTFYMNPLFQGRCASVGRNLRVASLPFVSGHIEIHVGDNVTLDGPISILSGRFMDRPQLRIGNGTAIGYNSILIANQEIVIEEDVIVSFDCRISDSDGHPRRADLRAQQAPLDPKDIRPVRICRRAWIGNGAHIMKGVTIGEGAIIGSNSVVISDIPPYCLALGNPAEIYFRNVGRPPKPPEKVSTPPNVAAQW
jgi:acetyltransferase-like isoleucine patch superfamily enzyme